ncbi:hypothetical protein [Burkholderia stabilis]|uniref:hypothetical protein n=1 Tax=Burkholderia stabilis TaxID=95485 RepID=UPI0013E93CCC|nr:hypothetical protein [Burkholderia stabilis]
MIEADIVEARRTPPQRLKHIETKSRRAAACHSATGGYHRADSSTIAAQYLAGAGIRSPAASMTAVSGFRSAQALL